MKILHLSAVLNWGGGGNHLENLCYEMAKFESGVKNLIVVGENGQFHQRLQNSNFHFTTVPLAFKADPRAIWKLIQICKKEKVDLIHIHGSTSLSLAVMGNFFAKLPPFVFSKKTSFPIKERKQTLYKYNHPRLKKILCVSNYTCDIAKKAIKDEKKLTTIYHGTRLDNKSSNTPFLLREKFNIPGDYKIVGNIGNHINAKDLPTWVAAIDHIVNTLNYKKIRFIQIGTASELSAGIKQKLKDRGLETFVHFLGYLPAASNFIPQFDTLLITSISEGMPQVIYEAFYHKTPVVSTNVGGIPELIAHNFNGLLTKPGAAADLGQHVISLLEDKERAQIFAERSFNKLIPEFTSENMARKTLEEYRKVLNFGSHETR